MEGAKIIRNIALVGAFWTGVTILVTEANAQSSVYDSEGAKSVSISPGMNPGTVPQAEINVDAGGTSAQDGTANSGGVQVQNVTVQAQAAAESEAQNSTSNAAEAINRARTDAELSNNALLLQQIELDRLKAEQKRISAINQFGDHLNQPTTLPAPVPASPCGLGPCVTPSAPLIENNNTIINDSPIGKSASVEIEEEVSNGSSFKDTKWGISPLLGMRWFDAKTMANVTNTFVLGAALTADVNNWVTAEGSFIYGQDQLAGFSCLGGCGYWNETTRDTYEIGVGAKLGPHMNGFRPYLALGLGYLMQNYDFINGSVTTNNITGNIGGGVDFEIAKNFAIGARADYQTLFGGNNNNLAGGFTMDQVYGDRSDRYRLGATATVMF
ncbi:MAG: outer membrane beta-barrel protein [Bdellovibrionota bacterium]